MEGSNSWTLLRTMSFISSRAKAFKQRFSHRQRSLSDSWMDQTSLDYTNMDDLVGPPAFEAGSTQSLLDENVEWEPGIVVQRSKSLESVSTCHRPSITTIYSAAVPLQCTQSSVSIAVTLNSRRPSTIMQKLPLPKPKEQLKLPSCEFIPQFFSTPLLQSPVPGDTDTELLMSEAADVGILSCTEDVHISERNSCRETMPKIQPRPQHQILTPILSRSRPCVPPSIHSTSCSQIADSQIPKIPGPPPTPKKLATFSDSKALGQPPALLDLANNPSENSEPLIDMSSPPQRQKSRPFSCASFDLLMTFDVPLQVQQTFHSIHSIPNLANETSAHFLKIPQIKAPPPTQKNLQTSNIAPLNPFTKPNDFVEAGIQSTSIPNLICTNETHVKTDAFSFPTFFEPFENVSIQQTTLAETTSDKVGDSRKTSEKPPYRKRMSISSSNLTLPLDSKKPPIPYDPEQWRKCVQETFSSIQETGEKILKTDQAIEANFSVNDKIKEKVPQLLKSQKYTKLKHQMSMDESRHHRVYQGNNVEAHSRLQEKRKIFFLRKQNNSAPEPIEEDETPIKSSGTQEKESHSVNLCIGRCKARGSDSSILLPTIKLEPEVGIEHLDDFMYPNADPPCHFCSQQSSTSIHDENRLKIMSGGLVRKRDGSRDEATNHYMNLPSPMIHSEGGGADSVFRPKQTKPQDDEAQQNQSNFLDEIKETQIPPPSALSRRRAIVTSRLTPNDSDEQKLSWSSNFNNLRTRRRSIVVIPPMQICPGDLLVYSKVLTNRQTTLDLESSSQCLNFDSEDTRKGKNTWSLLKLFERSNRGKSGSIGGLEEVLGCIQKAEFEDKELSYYRGLSWCEFYTKVDEMRKNPKKKKILGDSSNPSGSTISEDDSPTESKVLPAISKVPELLTFETIAQVEMLSASLETSKSSTKSDRSAASETVKSKKSENKSEKPEKQETTVRKLHRKLVRAQSERCFERSRLPSWKTKEKPLPSKPMPLIQTLSEKNLVSTVSIGSQGEYKRREAVWDLFQSKCAFLFDHLMVLKNVFLEPLKRIQVEGFAMFAEPQLLFGNLDELCSVTHNFCKSFIRILREKVGPNGELPTTEVLGELFQKIDSLSQAYHCYVLNYINALNYLESLRTHSEFCEFEKWCYKDERCKKLQLTDLLVAPVQHIMKVPLILKEIEMRTENANEKLVISQILEIEEKSIRELDDKMKWLKNFERLLEIQRNIVWPSVLELDPKTFVPDSLKPALQRQPCDRIIVSPRRQIIIEGQLQILDSGKAQEVFVVLFDDMLLITKRKKGLSKKKSTLSDNWASSCRSSANPESAMRYVVYKQPLSLDRFFVYDISLPESISCRLEYAFVLVVMNRFQQVVTIHSFQTSSDQIKQNWLTKLKETQEKWKKTLENTMFRTYSPQDLRNPNAVEMSMNESMNSYVKTPSGISFCSKSAVSLFESSIDLCSTIDQSSPLQGSINTRRSSGDEENQCFKFSVQVSPSATKHKKSF